MALRAMVVVVICVEKLNWFAPACDLPYLDVGELFVVCAVRLAWRITLTEGYPVILSCHIMDQMYEMFADRELVTSPTCSLDLIRR